MQKWHSTYPKQCVQVLNALKAKYGNLYRQDNVLLSGTHTHCGVAGYFQYTLFMITSKGYIKESVQPLVDGIVKVCQFFWSTSIKIYVMIWCPVFTAFNKISNWIKPQIWPFLQSIDRAHNNTKPGRIYRSRGDLEGNSVNRSPHSYMNNPEEERNRYDTLQAFTGHALHWCKDIVNDAFRYKWNTDKQVLVLKFTDLDGNGIGMLR